MVFMECHNVCFSEFPLSKHYDKVKKVIISAYFEGEIENDPRETIYARMDGGM